MGISFYGLFLFAVLVAVISALLCKQAIVFARALVFALLLPMLVGVLFIIPEALLTAVNPKAGSFDFNIIFFFALMGGIIGYIPAMLTIAVSDCLWVLWRVRYWFVPIILGALFSALYMAFFFDKGGVKDEAIPIFTAMGAAGGLLFVLLRRRWMPLAKQEESV